MNVGFNTLAKSYSSDDSSSLHSSSDTLLPNDIIRNQCLNSISSFLTETEPHSNTHSINPMTTIPETVELSWNRLNNQKIIKQYIGSEQINKNKNRYSDVLPYKYNCVKLNNEGYINASLIQIDDLKYVVTQGPMNVTIADFWQMIQFNKLPYIINLTNAFEKRGCKNIEKCHPYWEDDQKQYENVGLISIENEETDGELTQRTFKIQPLTNDLPSHVVQLHYPGWNDHGVPNFSILFQLMKKIPSYVTPVVHCSAGIGRSGTFVAIHSLLHKVSTLDLKNERTIAQLNSLDYLISLVEERVMELRQQRHNMVTSIEQYYAIIQALQEYVRMALEEPNSTDD